MIAWGLIVSDLYPLLNATSGDDLVWWTDEELYRAIEDAVRKLARAGAFAEQGEVPYLADDPVTMLPAQTISVIHVSRDGVSIRPANEAEMEALTAEWEEEAGIPEKYLVMPNGMLRVWRTPEAGGTLHIIRFAVPYLTQSATHRGPTVFAAHLKYSALATARAKDSDGAAPDIAQAARVRADLIEQQCRKLWGDSLHGV